MRHTHKLQQNNTQDVKTNILLKPIGNVSNYVVIAELKLT